MSQDPSVSDLREAGALPLGGLALPSPGRRRRKEAGQWEGQREPKKAVVTYICPSTACPLQSFQRLGQGAAAGSREEGADGRLEASCAPR